MQAHDWAWLDARESVTLSELSRICGLSAEELDELMGYGALVALQAAQPEPMFSAEFVAPLRTVAKLRMDFDLDLCAVAILLDHVLRIEALEREVQSLRAHLPGHEHKARRDGPRP